MNGVAPALIEETTMLPGKEDRGALEASKLAPLFLVLKSCVMSKRWTSFFRVGQGLYD